MVFKISLLDNEHYAEQVTDRLSMPKGGEEIVFVPITLVSGYSYWTADKVCHKSTKPFRATPGIKEGERPKYFLFMQVWDILGKDVKFLEITQVKTIRPVKEAFADKRYYNFAEGLNGLRIKASGSGMQIEYAVSVISLQNTDYQQEVEQCDNYLRDTFKVCFELEGDEVPASSPNPVADTYYEVTPSRHSASIVPATRELPTDRM
jgi:hypothetical protein